MSQDWLLRPLSQPIAPKREIGTGITRPKLHGGSSFQEELNKVLAKQQQEVTFSGHALERLRVRNISLTQDDLKRLGNAIDKVAAKGGRESLVVYKDTAYVISVKNRTVITAVDSAHMTDHVFTQIDSAVFA
ncbi:flagellar operon protein [Tumebacillus sp. BK434]|uniref:TIGR02530 family flagellar biosynthesis protein n=1 Tax=Tumebacillus sp. BK434 TaxID=2512169 RepID=UPI0010D18BCF|nr:TIGR02530 family flagellar biosynthesis protein [Tumebacillus sp. BK434]TCP58825.1 flagellar operon protein [Tumebacillus sp. BK434]